MADPTVTCASSTCTLVVTTTPYVAQQADYDAINAIFGIVLAAACVIWGVKAVFNVIRNRPEA